MWPKRCLGRKIRNFSHPIQKHESFNINSFIIFLPRHPLTQGFIWLKLTALGKSKIKPALTVAGKFSMWAHCRCQIWGSLHWCLKKFHIFPWGQYGFHFISSASGSPLGSFSTFFSNSSSFSFPFIQAARFNWEGAKNIWYVPPDQAAKPRMLMVGTCSLVVNSTMFNPRGKFKSQFFNIIENFSGAVEWFDWSEEFLKKCENQNRLHLSLVC